MYILKGMKNSLIVLHENIANKIYLIRSKKVMLDRDLAKLYQVPTKVLNQAVRRNIGRFPKDFMFELTVLETKNLRSQLVTSSWGGSRYKILCFTEQGVAMLSSVLKSERAIQVNIQIMRIFTKMRELIATNTKIHQKISEIEKKYDGQFKIVFDVLRKLLNPSIKSKKSIGFRPR